MIRVAGSRSYPTGAKPVAFVEAKLQKLHPGFEVAFEGNPLPIYRNDSLAD